MKLYESLNNSLDKQLQTLDESSEKLNEADNTVDTEEQKELKRALIHAYFTLQNKYETNIKAYEIAFQEAIEGLYPDKSWWEVTDCNIFMDLFETRDPWKTIMNIADKMIIVNSAEINDEITSDGEKEDDFVEQLKECLRKMNESPMSDEDKHDSDLIRNIISKRTARKNAALTPEEKEIMRKYNIKYDSDHNDLSVDGATINPSVDIETRYDWKSGKRRKNANTSKINYADRARKVADRAKTQVMRYDDYSPYSDSDEITTQGSNNSMWTVNNRDFNAHVKRTPKTLQDAERTAQNANHTGRYNRMKGAVSSRNSAKKQLDTIDADAEEKIARINAERDKKIADVERLRQYFKASNQRSLDRNQSVIDNLLRRNKDEALTEDFEHSPAKTIQELAEVWGKYDPDYLYYVNSKSDGAIVPEDNVIENIDSKYVYVEGSSVQGNPNFFCTVRIPISEFDKYYTLAVAE